MRQAGYRVGNVVWEMEAVSPVQPHILALDDDPAIRALIADYLAQNELRVTTVASGKEFMEVLARETVDLVVLDLRLPGEDGLQIARKLREESLIPILILTGRIDEADRVMGLELGADRSEERRVGKECRSRWS